MENKTERNLSALRRGLRSISDMFLSPSRHELRRQVLRGEADVAQPLNVILGAGPVVMPGWLSTDADMLDVRSLDHWEGLFHTGSIDRLMAEHLFEHLTHEECATAFRLCFRFLKSGGLLRLAVPDGHRKDAAYVVEVTPPKDGHRVLFTVEDLSQCLAQAGFVVTPLEYFDADEQFHCAQWYETDGLIRRSARYDRQEQFRRGLLYYTSLIVDARKPKT